MLLCIIEVSIFSIIYKNIVEYKKRGLIKRMQKGATRIVVFDLSGDKTLRGNPFVDPSEGICKVRKKKKIVDGHLPFREDVIMGSPENDTIIILLLNDHVIENERDKKRKISKRILRFSLSHSLSLFSHSTCIIYDILRIRACVEDHMASAAQRIAFSGGGGEVKQSPIKRGGKKSGQKGPFLSRELHVRIMVHTRTNA